MLLKPLTDDTFRWVILVALVVIAGSLYVLSVVSVADMTQRQRQLTRDLSSQKPGPQP